MSSMLKTLPEWDHTETTVISLQACVVHAPKKLHSNVALDTRTASILCALFGRGFQLVRARFFSTPGILNSMVPVPCGSVSNVRSSP